MDQIVGLPYCEIEFTKSGACHPPSPLFPAGTTDLLVISHGWKNNEVHARTLYESIVQNMLAAGGAASGRVFSVEGVRWPSFLFKPDLSLLPDGDAVGDGGAAGMADTDFSREELKEYAAEVGAELGIANLDAFLETAEHARNGGGDAQDLVETLRAATLQHDPRDQDVAGDHTALFEAPGEALVEAFKAPPQQPAHLMGGGAGAAAGFTDTVSDLLSRWRSGARAGVAGVLNQFTYYEMKARAGIVGRALAPVLDTVPAEVRIHLVGHSFGARVVSAAAAAMTRPVASLTLLQGAYSHNGLGLNIGGTATAGAFRAIIATHRVTGPIAVTHTHNDTAVGFYYALASTLSGDVAAAYGLTNIVGGPNDLHGGIGANGALSMGPGEALPLSAHPGQVPSLTAGKVTNIQADQIIADHNDVQGPDVGRVVWGAIKLT